MCVETHKVSRSIAPPEGTLNACMTNTETSTAIMNGRWRNMGAIDELRGQSGMLCAAPERRFETGHERLRCAAQLDQGTHLFGLRSVFWVLEKIFNVAFASINLFSKLCGNTTIGNRGASSIHNKNESADRCGLKICYKLVRDRSGRKIHSPT